MRRIQHYFSNLYLTRLQPVGSLVANWFRSSPKLVESRPVGSSFTTCEDRLDEEELAGRYIIIQEQELAWRLELFPFTSRSRNNQLLLPEYWNCLVSYIHQQGQRIYHRMCCYFCDLFDNRRGVQLISREIDFNICQECLDHLNFHSDGKLVQTTPYQCLYQMCQQTAILETFPFCSHHYFN